MERAIYKEKKARLLLPGILLCGGAVFLLTYPQLAAQGAREGLTLCAATVIPSLFPFLVLSSFFTRSGLCARLGKGVAFLTRLFRLPGAAAGAILLSLLGGFPVGLRMIADLLEEGLLTRVQARRMSLFCVNAGPAYLIGAVGSGMLGSRRAGWLLFGCLSISALLTGLLLSPFAPRETVSLPPPPTQNPPVTQALVDAVTQATSAVASVCAWIVLFSCFCSALAHSPLPREWRLFLQAVLEVTQSSRTLCTTGNLPLLAAGLGWGGLCLHCQILPCLRRIGQKLPLFLLFRTLHALLAALLCRAALIWFPLELPAFSNGVTAQPALFSLSAPAAAVMLLMGALLILDIGKAKTHNSLPVH